MTRSSTVHSFRIPVTLALLLGATACGAPDLESNDESVATESESAISAGSGLLIQSSSDVTLMTPNFVQNFDGSFWITNQTGKTVTMQKQLFFLAAQGGYAYRPPSFDVRFGPTLAPGEMQGCDDCFGWNFTAPVSHLVMRTDGTTSSGTKVGTLRSTPVRRAGFADPEPSPYVDDIGVGVEGPLEILTLTSGERWLPVLATFVDTTNSATSSPSITLIARNASNQNIATLSRTNGPIALPIRAFAAWTALSASASVTKLNVKAQQSIGGKTVTSTRDIPVSIASPAVLKSPVAGRWTWNNGPGRTGWNDVHSSPDERYGYDMGINQVVNGVPQSHQGDPTLNSNYFRWGKPIRASAAGTVRYAVDSFLDNNGNLHDNDVGSNEVIIEHANGIFTRYSHLRRGSKTVNVGQTVAAGAVIGQVGNSGGTSEPHLHYVAFKVDNSGLQRALPMTITGLKSTSGASLSGVPKSPGEYVAP